MNFIMEIKATCQLPFVAGVHTKEGSHLGKTIVTILKSNNIVYHFGTSCQGPLQVPLVPRPASCETYRVVKMFLLSYDKFFKYLQKWQIGWRRLA